jgi:hypothetical protein
MSLYPRRAADHYPDRDPVHVDQHVVLCGGLEVGGWHRITSGPSEGHLHWGVGLTASAGFGASGYATTVEDCRRHVGTSFRAMLARADLRERADAKPGPPHRAPPEPSIEPSAPLRPYDRNADRHLGGMQRNELSRVIRSGELHVGVLRRSTHGAEHWSWWLDGVAHPDDPDFVWQGEADTEAEAFDAFARRWSQWLAWAGLEQIGELQRGVRR